MIFPKIRAAFRARRRPEHDASSAALDRLAGHKIFRHADAVVSYFSLQPRDLHRAPGYHASAIDLADWGEPERVAYLDAMMDRERHAFFKKAVAYSTYFGGAGDYHEYGCHQARTFRDVLSEARKCGRNDMMFYAFDSFEGMPAMEPGSPSYEFFGPNGNAPGSLATSLEDFMALVKAHGIYVDRVRAVKGFYDKSLTPELQAEMLSKGRHAGFITVDCDLYESAVPVFRFIEPFIVEGTVIYLDDYRCYRGSPARGVAAAFREFEARSRFRFDRFLDVGFWGTSFIAY